MIRFLRDFTIMAFAFGVMMALLSAMTCAWHLLIAPAHAETQVPCWIIKSYVKSYGGEEAAIKAAKDHGWTEADIAKAKRRCGRLN